MCISDDSGVENPESRQDEIFDPPGIEDIQPAGQTELFQALDGYLALFGDDRVSLLSQQEAKKSSDVASDNNSEDLGTLLYSASVELVPLKPAANLAQESDTDVSNSEIEAEPLTTSLRANISDRIQDEEHFEISPQISAESVVTGGERQPFENLAHPIACAVLSPSGTEVIADSTVSSRSSSLLSLPLSPQETEGFDEMRSLQAITLAGADAVQDMVLSGDLQGVNTTPFVKEELKERIKSRRQQKGLPLPEVKDDEQKPDILTKDEEEKRRIRRERNRIAAAKCRKKKKAKAMEKRKAAELILEQNIALLDEMEDLMNEKAKLQRMWREHQKVCNRQDLVSLELPQVTSIRISTTRSISDSDSLEDTDMGGPLVFDSSDSESVDLTEDLVGDRLIDSSLMTVLEEDANPSGPMSDQLLQALNILSSMDDFDGPGSSIPYPPTSS